MPYRRGRKSAAQTPAPRSERIKGSKKNPKGTAASKSSAYKIVLSEKTIKALSQKAKDYNKNHKNSVTLNTLKAVYRRGLGAYSSSHRPTITGGVPNTRNAWAMARVNKFLMKKSGKKVKAAYVQDDDLLAKGGNVFDDKELLKRYKQGKSIGFSAEAHLKAKGLLPRADGKKRKSEKYQSNQTYSKGGSVIKVLLAPNGKKSNLTPEQYKLVRTPEFKAWFGDWENDPENASKVVDENGEPLVVYRGDIQELGKYGFEFKLGLNLLKKKNKNNFGFFFTDDVEVAKKYRLEDWDGTLLMGEVNPFFIDARKILDLTDFGIKIGQKTFINELIEKGIKFNGFEYLKNKILEFDYNEYKGWGNNTFDYFDVFPELRDLFIANGYNSIVFKEISRMYFPYKVFVAFQSNQIKLADGSNTKFDGSNPDIRYAKGGEVDEGQENFGTPSFTFDQIPLIHETYNENVNNILKNGIKKSTNRNITSGVYTIPLAWKPKSFNSVRAGIELVIMLKSGSKIFWTDTNRPTDFYYGGGNKYYRKLFEKLSNRKPYDLKAKEIDRVNFLRKFEKWLQKNGYCGVQQGGEIVITDLSCIDTIKKYNRGIKTKYSFGGLIAPNGKPSNLTSEQYKLVRTPEFKAWFGDWENDPENASKVVDENGEPLVVYHNTDKVFHKWDFKKINRNRGTILNGAYFTPISDEQWGKIKIAVFLSIKNPLTFDFDNLSVNVRDVQAFIKENKWFWIEEMTKDSIDKYKSGDDNGLIFLNTKYSGVKKDEYCVFKSYQIKLADGTNTTFDGSNPDIRFESGGKTDEVITCSKCGWSWKESETTPEEKYFCHKCGLDNKPTMDKITMDVPLFIRLLEFAREDAKDDMELHTLTENAIKLGDKTLTMDDYNDIVFSKITSSKITESTPEVVEFPTIEEEFSDGGVVVGKRHSESDEFGTGEKFLVESTGQVVELEGGEGVLCKESMQSKKIYKFDGKEMTGRQIASFLNHKYGGVEFAKGGEVDEKSVCGCRSMYYHGGELPSATLDSLKGGEAVVTVKTMESKDKFQFQGRNMTPRKILSHINQESGGKKFEDGGIIDLTEHHLKNATNMVKMINFTEKIFYF